MNLHRGIRDGFLEDMTDKPTCESETSKQELDHVEIFKFCKGIWTLFYELGKTTEGY